MQDYAYYNGVFCPYDAMTIPLSDRSIFFGDAVYDVMIGALGVPYQANEHFSRLFKNAKQIGLVDLPDADEMLKIIFSLVELSRADEFIIYIQLSGRGARRGHLRSEDGVNLLVTITEAAIPSKLEYSRAITLPDERHRLCDIKSTNLLSAVMSVKTAKDSGTDIAIFHRGEDVTECSYANLSMYKDGVLVFHPFDRDILDGITQRNLTRLCEELSVKTEERIIKTNELLQADFVIYTSTTKFFKIVESVNGIDLSARNLQVANKLFDALKEDFWKQIQDKCSV